MSNSKLTVCFAVVGMAASLTLLAVTRAQAAPLPVGDAAMKGAASHDVIDVRWRGGGGGWRGGGGGWRGGRGYVAGGVAAGIITGAIIASRRSYGGYGYDYDYDPSYYNYAPPYAYVPAYEPAPVYVDPGYGYGGYGYGYEDVAPPPVYRRYYRYFR